MMGSGKSAVGRLLAGALGRPFIDLDIEIEQSAGRTVAAIFAEEGEPGFRAREAAAVVEALGTEGAVVSCGGGVVLTPANVDHLRRDATVVWLTATPRVAAARLASDGGRPLLAGMAGDLEDRIATLTAERRGAYAAAAHLIVDADPPAAEVAAAIEQALR